MHLSARVIMATGISLVLGLASCGGSAQSGKGRQDSGLSGSGLAAPQPGLKDYYKDYFPVGVAVNSRNIKGPEAALILKEYNSVTPENDMKMGPVHPAADQYNFAPVDSIVAFARRHGLKVRGHNLCWHEQTPDWLFKDAGGGEVAKSVLLSRLRDHIRTVVSRYKKDVYCWDVVNEAISDDSTELLRKSPWLKIIGPSFIDSAFWYAHRADPKAELYYNDYNVVFPEKAKRIYTLLKGLKQRGVPITGIGIQAHWSVYQPTEQQLRSTLDLFKSLGLKIQITELDVSVFPWEKNKRALLPKDQIRYQGQVEDRQTAFYKMIFKVFRDYKGVISGVTFWNVSDRDTWLNYYPVEGRKNYPLLFDSALKRKPAYQAVTDFKGAGATAP
ncbi:endo-1,4-beta-xylanase [Arachidicoccus rhizosphaerae]|uniref:Beta-xylanase n=1 Tax=Arachidicoccus rhizosphaerae TaxID=551991 RepID=A0A1H3VEP1_9BACT|nr:endo-1,4-beta-xylanase [Arachidicoccus rhizosphaerae]SDZ73243.1 endo-1,4-beta-xylanase [Arachidicoccus rhizosphaerae]